MKKERRNFTETDIRNINIDVNVSDVDTKKTDKFDKIGAFIVSIHDTKILKILGGFIFSIILLIGIIALVYVKPNKSDDLVIISTLAEEDEWEFTPALKNSIARGEISISGITVTTCGTETYLTGGDSDKLVILNYRTEIEDNKYPQKYSDEYFEKLCREGKNTYVVKTLGLATEATNEGAE